MPTGVAPDPLSINEFRRLRLAGFDQGSAARQVGLSAAWASRFEHNNPIVVPDGVGAPDGVLEDFGLFRETYLSHVRKPWMDEAAETVWRLIQTTSPEFLVINCPPGAGKSSFLQDLFTWFIVRDRRIRCVYGAATQSNAGWATGLIKSYLEATEPPRANPKLVEVGEAVQSTRTLAADFGLFRPESERGGSWSKDAWRVATNDGGSQANKEPTMMAVGRSTEIIGNRFEAACWDDLVTETLTRSVTENDKLRTDWDGGLGESRVEPGNTGLLFLVGQRIGPQDLYRYNLDKTVTEWVDGREVDRPMYTHIMFPAHFDEACSSQHAPAVARPWPHGCLLDPVRLPWYGPKGLKAKRENSPNAYATQFQQQDGSSDDALVHRTWIYGGRDSEGVEREGCLNRGRTLRQMPSRWSRGDTILSMVTVDPSPTKFWALQWWAVNVTRNERALMNLMDRVMTANVVFDFLPDRDQPYVGVLEQWWWEARDAGLPIRHVVFEINAAQRFFDERQVWKDWCRDREVGYHKHTTSRNKADPELGLSLLIEPYRSGWYDLPYGDVESRVATDSLARQLCQQFERNDQLMANWFMEMNQTKLRPKRNPNPTLSRPSWLSGSGRRRTT